MNLLCEYSKTSELHTYLLVHKVLSICYAVVLFTYGVNDVTLLFK